MRPRSLFTAIALLLSASASGQAPEWNFHKYLVGRDGRLIASFPSMVTPLDGTLVGAIEKALAR
jgi:glutathione peroxidase